MLLPASGDAEAVYLKYPVELVSWVGYVVMGVWVVSA